MTREEYIKWSTAAVEEDIRKRCAAAGNNSQGEPLTNDWAKSMDPQGVFKYIMETSIASMAGSIWDREQTEAKQVEFIYYLSDEINWLMGRIEELQDYLNIVLPKYKNPGIGIPPVTSTVVPPDGLPDTPPGYVYLLDADGKYVLDADGSYVLRRT